MKLQNIIFWIALVFITWCLSWLYIDHYLFPDNQQNAIVKRGAFGDKFGFINSLFSGLAFGAIIISLHLQNKELSDTRKEFINQTFQTTFFNLLKTQRQITDEINCTIRFLEDINKRASKHVQGRAFFRLARQEMTRIENALNFNNFQRYREWGNEELQSQIYDLQDQQEETNLAEERAIGYTLYYYNISEDQFNSYTNFNGIEKGQFLYQTFYKKHNYVYDHYFGHLYHILCFLESFNENINTEKVDFGNSIKAQLSIPEMFLLNYHCLADTKLRPLVTKYKLLERLDSQNPIPEHHRI